ncbi:MAG: protein kinase [Myxococcales bacterium]|nr:protein kinase [Myxococcales bacterium]
MKTPLTKPLLLGDQLVGRRVGEYEVLEPIGEGGMGVVYRGIHPLIKKRVAIKVLKPGAATDAGHVKRLLAEAEAVNAIGHRNIIDIFGLGQLDDGRPYIVMEFLEGEPLDAYLRANRSLPLDEVLSLLLEVASPLAAAHAKGVIHRDLKPSNIFRCQQADGGPYLKLLDFGLAKKAMEGGSSAQTSQNLIAGTPNYMAPEQVRAVPVSPRTDIYAFGVMAYEILTGSVPYDGQTPMDVMMAHVTRPVPSVRTLVPSLPEEVDRLIRRMMAKSPEDRPASMGDVRAELKGLLSNLSPTKSMDQQLELEPSAVPQTSSSEAWATSTQLQFGAVHHRRGPVLMVGLLAITIGAGLVVLLRDEQVSGPRPLAPEPPVRVLAEPSPPVERMDTPVTDDLAATAAPRPSATAVRPAVARRPPTGEQLRLRVESMRRELERLTPGGEAPNPADLRMLDRFTLESFSPETDLSSLERKLATFERGVLKPMRQR